MDREELKEYATGETISKMTYLNQLVSMKISKFGSPSENASPFNEIEKILDNVNPDDLLEPEVKSTKKARRGSQNQKRMIIQI